MGLVEKLPEITQTVMQSRADSQAKVQQQAQQQQQQAMLAQQQAQARAIAQQRQAAMQRVPVQVQATPVGRPGPQRQPPPGVVPPGFAPPWAQPRPIGPAPAMSEPMAPAPQGQTAVPAEASPAPSGFDAVPTQQEELPPSESGAPVALDLQPEQVGEFLQELENAIRGGIIPPGLFAQGFIGRVGADVAKSLVGQISPDLITQMVQSQEAGASMAIVTRDGQRYLRDLWAEVARLTSA
jgi:hypothetical protein